MYMSYIWLGVVILLTLVECMTIGLTTIWFVVSALVALIVSLTNDNFVLQFGIFVILGIFLLITTRPILLKFLKPKKEEKTNFDRIIGMEGIVTEEISRNVIGEVKVDGKKWSASSNKKIPKDSIVKILGIDGVKLKVEKVEE